MLFIHATIKPRRPARVSSHTTPLARSREAINRYSRSRPSPCTVSTRCRTPEDRPATKYKNTEKQDHQLQDIFDCF